MDTRGSRRPEEPAARAVRNWLARRFPGRDLPPDTDLERDLGLDSMDWLHLALEIEQETGNRWTDEAISRVDTLQDLFREAVALSAAGEETRGSFLDDPEAHLGDARKRWLSPLTPVEARLATGLYRLNRWVMRSVFRLRVEGSERIPGGQAVFTPTHGSFLDPLAVAAALDRDRLAHTFWAADRNLAFGNPAIRRFSRLGQAVPFDAEHGFVSGMASAAAVLKHGDSLIWFPEGRRSRSTKLQSFKPGIGMLLKRFPAPVVPIAIRGAHDAFPPGRILPRPRPIVVAFGNSLHPGELERQGKGEQAELRIARALRRHTEELYSRIAAS